MSLLVEVAGFGICRAPEKHGLLIICVQQENFQAWTVYRRYHQFCTLSEQLRDLYPSLPQLPHVDETELGTDYLEICRTSLNKWIQQAGTFCHFNALFNMLFPGLGQSSRELFRLSLISIVFGNQLYSLFFAFLTFLCYLSLSLLLI